jgi:hypothetical protein
VGMLGVAIAPVVERRRSATGRNQAVGG